MDDGPGAQGAVEAFLAESPPATRRWHARRADASLQDVEVVSHALAEGGATACLTIRNISELSRLEAAVTERSSAPRSSGQLVGGVAHDLGNLFDGDRLAKPAPRRRGGERGGRRARGRCDPDLAKRGSSLTKQLARAISAAADRLPWPWTSMRS